MTIIEYPKYLLVDSKVLPEIFLKVISAKNLIAKGSAKNSSEAARMCGLSRSAFYKYKDSVHEYDSRMSGSVITLYISLEDEPGVLSSLISAIYTAGGNIVTVNQNIPADGVAPVTISLKPGDENCTLEQLRVSLEKLNGVIKVRQI
ncbi:MAG: ACT domain-containing protein [Oscillospiraceae bacterium]